SPQTKEGKEYWNKLYKKAEELFGTDQITIPTLTRPWIVPGEIIVRETGDSAFIYKSTLKVMLEQDHLKDSTAYNFKDPRMKELNEYSSQLIRELIIPKLTKEINTAKRYVALRQVFYSLILARWFKARFAGQKGLYSSLINSQNLSGLTSKENWSKDAYFKEYQKSFKQGEYNIQEPVHTPSGQVIRSYFSGGEDFTQIGLNGFGTVGSAVISKIPNTLRMEMQNGLPSLQLAQSFSQPSQGPAASSALNHAAIESALTKAGLNYDYLSEMIKKTAIIPFRYYPFGVNIKVNPQVIKGDNREITYTRMEIGRSLFGGGFIVKFGNNSVSKSSASEDGKFVEDWRITVTKGGARVSGSVNPIQVTKLVDDVMQVFASIKGQDWFKLRKSVIDLESELKKQGVNYNYLSELIKNLKIYQYIEIRTDIPVTLVSDSVFVTPGLLIPFKDSLSVIRVSRSILNNGITLVFGSYSYDALGMIPDFTKYWSMEVSREYGLKISGIRGFMGDMTELAVAIMGALGNDRQRETGIQQPQAPGASLAAGDSKGKSSSSSVILKFFNKKLDEKGFTINLDVVDPDLLGNSTFVDNTQWFLYRFTRLDKGVDAKFLDIFIKDNEIIGYGLVTLMGKSAILRFQSFEHDKGLSASWAKIYQERVEKLKETFRSLNKVVEVYSVPMDQILSEAQITRRVFFALYPGTDYSIIQGVTAGIIDKIRRGVSLNSSEMQLVVFNDFEGYDSFGPAADFYVNKLGCKFVATVFSQQKLMMNSEEKEILAKLQSGQKLREEEIINLFSGRGLVQSASSGVRDLATLPQVVENSGDNFIDGVATILALGNGVGGATFGNISIHFGNDRDAAREDLTTMNRTILDKVNGLLNRGLAQWKVLTDPSALVEGDIVREDFTNGRKETSRYNHSTPNRSYNMATGESKITGAVYYCTPLERSGGSFSAFNLQDVQEGRIEVLVSSAKKVSLSGARFLSRADVHRLIEEGKAGWVPLEKEKTLNLRRGDILAKTVSGSQHMFRFEAFYNDKELIMFDMERGFEDVIAISDVRNWQLLARSANVALTSILFGDQQVFRPGASSAVSEKVGGIDFRVMNIVTQPMAGLTSLNLKLPVLANLAEYNLDEEFQQIQKMLQAGIAPSGDRIKEYLAACQQKGQWNNRIADVVGCLAEICRIEEDNVREVSPGIKEAILLADSVEVSG
ncbi:MAG: hypothetical protein HZC15_06635, partial [Candidatus Omnitrophica bacterium]|nr:hypothetical protein [Candidatus Omnitrophota bacterium]